ncbi:hypothetical protein [Bradyrhizobium neotropicale]|uniref:hypothetical protein n=1 Tax=Bradyrhizobium neotropicale TaxID=1497615 RepID=UPI001AD6F280|nr:hypothetical protein [Bradyrhizobium neotropicale]MBO4228065.1 hypothetical protein [Bradyrhizobium neotropicale]
MIASSSMESTVDLAWLVPPASYARSGFRCDQGELVLSSFEAVLDGPAHRHVSLVMLAFAMMAVIRHRANTGPCSKKRDPGLDQSFAFDPLVDPGNPAHRHEARPAAHPARPRPRMVVLAQGS